MKQNAQGDRPVSSFWSDQSLLFIGHQHGQGMQLCCLS